MNEQFTDGQIETYAKQFREGDAIFVNNNWERVIACRKFEVTTENDEIDNSFLINRGIGVVEGFRVGSKVAHPYRVTTLEHYELQGGEKIVWLGDSNEFRTFGKVYDVLSPDSAEDVYYIDSGLAWTPYGNSWGVIPTYKQVLTKQLEKAVGTLPVENMTVDEFEEDGLNDELLELLGKKYTALEDKHMSIYNERRELESEIARKQSEMNKLDELMSNISKIIQSLEN